MNLNNVSLAAVLFICCALPAHASPVTGWSIGLNNPGLVSLTGDTTASPTLGDGTAEDADNTAIHASFPSITLAVGEKLTLSGSVQVTTAVGNPATAAGVANNFRWGVFDVNGSATLSGWLGYYASAPDGGTASGVRRRTTTGAYYSQTGTTLLYANSLTDTTKRLVDSTYSFTLNAERTGSGIKLSATLDNPLGYSLVPLTFEDTGATTFTFNRVGFLAGDALNADQFQFSNVDVSVVVVPEPGVASLILLAGTILLATRRQIA